MGLLENNELFDNKYQKDEIKKLLFKIDKATGFPTKSSTFAYYNLCGKVKFFIIRMYILYLKKEQILYGTILQITKLSMMTNSENN